MTAIEGRKPGRSGPGKSVLLACDSAETPGSGIEPARTGDNQAGSQLSASFSSTPAGRVGSACEALSAKDGVEAGSSPALLLGTSAVKGREHVRTPPIQTKASLPVSVLSKAHTGLHFAIEHAGSPELADEFRQVRRVIFDAIREAMQNV